MTITSLKNIYVRFKTEKCKTNKEVEDRKRSEKTQQYNFYCK